MAVFPLHGRRRETELVREFLTRPEYRGVPRSRPVPVLVFTGTRGSGKTTFLTELSNQLDQEVPYARDNFEFTRDLPVRDRLSALAFELNRKCGRYGRLSFPRLVTGQLAIAQTLNASQRSIAHQQIVTTLEEYRNITKLREFLADTAPEVLAPVSRATLGTPLPGTVAGRYVPDLLLNGLTSGRLGRRVVLGEGQNWYGHQDRGLRGDPIDALVDLNRWARQPDNEEYQREVGELLWAAFLADLREGFRQGWRADERTLNCVVLLDNVDTQSGRTFLDGLIRARRQHTAHTDDPDPLTIVATSRGTLVTRVTARGESVPTAADASYEDYLRRSRGQRERGWYPVLLRNLTQDEIANMVAALGLHTGTNRSIAAAVHRFTNGHPGATRLMLDAIHAGIANPTELRTLLVSAEPAELGAEPATVEQRLLDQFLLGVSDAVFQDLVTCAAAQDLNQALDLAAHSALLASAPGERPEVFAPELWIPAGREGVQVMPQVLRRLLLLQLADRADDDRAGWSRVHQCLRKNNADDQARELYYALADHDVEFVTRRLAGLLREQDVTGWLGMLTAVTAAPNRLDPRVPALDHVQALSDWADPQEPPVAPLARLVAAQWINDDPLGERYQRSLLLEIAAEYDEIAPHSSNGLATLRDEADKYRQRADMAG